jgi:hypothetical protein
MGNFRIEIQAVGGHGCSRDVKSGGKVEGCKSPTCPDCLAREFVQKLKAAGVYLEQHPTTEPGCLTYAKLVHWPYGHGTVTDDLLTGVRNGDF